MDESVDLIVSEVSESGVGVGLTLSRPLVVASTAYAWLIFPRGTTCDIFECLGVFVQQEECIRV